MNRLIIAISTAFAATVAQAGVPVPLPEPGTLELLALGGAVAAVIALRNRRRK
jgi:hypothetical protein